MVSFFSAVNHRPVAEVGEDWLPQASRNVLDPAVTRHPYLHFSATSVFFICERHDVLTSNITFQDNLLHVLLSVD